MSTTTITYLLMQPLSDAELAATRHNTALAPAVRRMAELLLGARLAHAAGDYYTAAQNVAAMREV